MAPLLRSTRGNQMLWVQLFLLIGLVVLLFPLLKVIGTFITHLGSTSSPTEKGFLTIADKVQSLLDENRQYYWEESVSITVDAGYAIFGFDADYTPTPDFYALKANPYASTAYNPSDRDSLRKPEQCPTGEACLCLAKMESRKPAEWVKCKTFGEDVVLAGVPFYRDALHTSGETPKVDALRDIYMQDDTTAWTPMNFGLLRQDKNRAPLESLNAAGFSKKWYSWYGYLYLPGKILVYEDVRDDGSVGDNFRAEGMHTYYIEKFRFADVEYILVIPAYVKDISRFGQELLSTRTQQKEKEEEQIISRLKGNIKDLASNLSEKEYIPLYGNCTLLGTFTDNLSDSCSLIEACIRGSHAGECRVESTPCVCNTDRGPKVCRRPYCYSSGCADTSRDEACGSYSH